MKDEKELINELILGKGSAYAELFEVHGAMVFNLALLILQQKEDAEDLVQEVFAEVVKSIASFKHESSLKTWLYKITSNKALDYIRKRNRKKRFAFFVSKDATDEVKQIGHFVHPGIQLEQKELAQYLFSAISTLPERQQLAFTLHKIEGLSYKEISEVMESSLSSIETLIHRAKNQLKKKIGRLLCYFKLTVKEMMKKNVYNNMKRQEDWINKVMDSTDGLIPVQPSEALKAKTLTRMNKVSKENIYSVPMYWAIAASIALVIGLNIGFVTTLNDSKSSDITLVETDWYSQNIDLDLTE